MKSILIAAIAIVAGSLITGCGPMATGTERNLGPVSYPIAYAAARDVMSQHFSIEYSDVDSGVIKCYPKNIGAEKNRLLGSTTAREEATLRLTRSSGDVLARLTIAMQCAEGEAAMTPWTSNKENYSGVGNETPAQMNAATTSEQNDSWRRERYDHSLERKMLDELAKALAPADTNTTVVSPAKTPTSAPASR